MRGRRNQALETLQFVRAEFEGADLGDRRLNRRLVRIAADLSMGPGRSLPAACGTWASTKGAYRFFSNPAVRRETVLAKHVEATARRVQAEPTVLVIEDTTVLNFTPHPATQGLGKIGARKWRNQLLGGFVHSALAIQPDTHEVLGLVAQETWIREEYRPEGETREERQSRERESGKWMKCARRAVEVVGDPRKAIFVFDREGDLWEVLSEIPFVGARYVIRAAWNRRLEESGQHLMEQILQSPIRSYRTLEVPARGKRPRRTVRLAVRAQRCSVKAPSRIPGAPVQELNVVHVKEEEPPPGVEPLEWTLLTTEAIDREQDLFAILDHYRGRWKIEEWHKILKSGCRIEMRQLESWRALEALLGVFSVLACRVLALRDVGRTTRPIAVSDIVNPIEEKILRARDRRLSKQATAAEFVRSIAKLGGFLARKGDGEPGCQTIWEGLKTLSNMEQGYTLAQQEENRG